MELWLAVGSTVISENWESRRKAKTSIPYRHTVVNKLTSKKVYEPFIKELIGHSHDSITMDVYGGKKPLDVLLNECVLKI